MDYLKLATGSGTLGVRQGQGSPTDFNKPNDKFPHGRLLENVGAQCTGCSLLRWIRTSLTEYLSLLVLHSPFLYHPVTSGVPQGLVPGMVLLAAYVSDIPPLFEQPCLVYAYDVKL